VCCSKHVEPSINFGIINSITKLHRVGISTESSTMHGSVNINSILDRGGWSTSRPSRFTPGGRSSTHCIEGWMGPRAGLDGCGKSRPQRDLISDRLARTDHAIPAPNDRHVPNKNGLLCRQTSNQEPRYEEQHTYPFFSE
jgi:hypothetical protein